MYLNTKFLTKNPCPSTRLDVNKFFERPDNNMKDIINIMTPNITQSSFVVANHTPAMTKMYNLKRKIVDDTPPDTSRMNRYFNKSRNIFNLPEFVLGDNGGLKSPYAVQSGNDIINPQIYQYKLQGKTQGDMMLKQAWTPDEPVAQTPKSRFLASVMKQNATTTYEPVVEPVEPVAETGTETDEQNLEPVAKTLSAVEPTLVSSVKSGSKTTKINSNPVIPTKSVDGDTNIRVSIDEELAKPPPTKSPRAGAGGGGPFVYDYSNLSVETINTTLTELNKIPNGDGNIRVGEMRTINGIRQSIHQWLKTNLKMEFSSSKGLKSIQRELATARDKHLSSSITVSPQKKQTISKSKSKKVMNEVSKIVSQLSPKA